MVYRIHSEDYLITELDNALKKGKTVALVLDYIVLDGIENSTVMLVNNKFLEFKHKGEDEPYLIIQYDKINGLKYD
ncbi:MAG: hypothetical protein IJH63_00650 [Methanobrevibacter sp.]|nr:hypothetical protein [Methanosphaera sp.]MBR0369213.1 hypothetical protein [Methanobrevibacter sp.]